MTAKIRTAILAPTKFETREEGNDIFIEGYFSTFSGRYEYDTWDGKHVYETIDRNAFDEALANNADVRALINHDTTLVLGRTGAGTLSLSVDDHGLYGRVLINRADTDAMNAYARVQRGDVSQCSFGFEILDFNSVRETDGLHMIIKRVKLYEVSICTFPAYQDTAVQARCKEFEENQKRHTEQLRADLRKRLKGEKAC